MKTEARKWPAIAVAAFLAVVIGLARAQAQTLLNREGSATNARILVVTGMDYPGHLWRQTTPVLVEQLRKDSRLQVFTVEDPHFLDSPALHRYDAVVLFFMNWEQPAPGAPARENLRRFVAGGKGLMLLHFA